MKKRRCAALLTLKLAIVLAEGELRGSELAEARAWIARRRDDAPDITDLQRAFLSASEAAEEARIGAEQKLRGANWRARSLAPPGRSAHAGMDRRRLPVP